MLSNAPDPRDDEATDGRGKHDKEPALPTACIRKKAERRARVLLVCQVDKRINRDPVVKRQPFDDRPLRDLVGNNDAQRDSHPRNEACVP